MSGWEQIASRMTRDECLAVLSAQGVIADGLDTDFIRADRRWLGVVADIWFNRGRFDPGLAVNTAWDATTGKFRGGLTDGVRHFQPWQVPVHSAEPYDFLAPILGAQRAAKLVRDVAIDSIETDAQTTYGASDDAPANTSADPERFVQNPELLWCGPFDGTVTGAPTTTSVSTTGITASSSAIVGRRVVFGPESAGTAFSTITNNGSGYCRVTATAGAGAYDHYEVNDRVIIGMGQSSSNGGSVNGYKRGHKITAIAGDTSYFDTDVAYTADSTSGKSYNAAAIQSGVVTSFSSGVLGFTTPLSEAPRLGAYVAIIGLSEGTDRSIAACAAQLAAMPVGARIVRINQANNINYATSAGAWYCDGRTFGINQFGFELTTAILEPVHLELWTTLKTELDSLGATLDGVYYDWEGGPRLDNFTSGQLAQAVAEHEADDYPLLLGFDPAEVPDIGTGVTGITAGAAIPDDHKKVWATHAVLLQNSMDHIAALVEQLHAVFPDAKATCFRAGSLCGWRTRPDRPYRLQSNVYYPGAPAGLIDDVTVQGKRPNYSSYVAPDLVNDVYWVHPDASASGTDDAALWGGQVMSWRAIQAQLLSGGEGVFPTAYQPANVLNTVYSGQWLAEIWLQLLMSAGVPYLLYLNDSTTDDSLLESVILELDEAIPHTNRRPVAVDDPKPESWQPSFLWSCVDAGRYRYWYVKKSPTAEVSFELDGDRAVVVVTREPYAQRKRIEGGQLFSPATRAGSGIWIRQS